jgi:hypothetical protein
MGSSVPPGTKSPAGELAAIILAEFGAVGKEKKQDFC